MSVPEIFVSAGDPSGDIATARLITALKVTAPELQLFGLGGPRLAQRGQEQFARATDLAVLGFWEVARRAGFFRRLLRQCEQEITRRRPRCILLVDYPGFNLRLAARVKKLGIPIIYYISPQVWAWHKKRIYRIKELVDRMLLILPFEQELYVRHGIPHEMVGHYLVEDVPHEYIASDPPGSGQLALLPGSRTQEIERMLAPMLAAARTYLDRFGGRAVVAGIDGAFDYDTVLRQAGEGISVSFEDSRRLLYESDLVLTASGTATLEAGIIARPMVVIYKTGFITYQIARRLVTLPMIALVNLVIGEKIVPELIQHEASPERMAAELAWYKEDDTYRENVLAALKRVAGILGGRGASERAAKVVEGYL